MGWAGHVASVGKKRNAYVGMVGGNHFEELDVYASVRCKGKAHPRTDHEVSEGE
jgi:hypothetical protein